MSPVFFCCCVTCHEFESLFKPQSTQIITDVLKCIYSTGEESLSSWHPRISTLKMCRFLTPLTVPPACWCRGLRPSQSRSWLLLTPTTLQCPLNWCKVKLTWSSQFLEVGISLNTLIIPIKQIFTHLYWQALNHLHNLKCHPNLSVVPAGRWAWQITTCRLGLKADTPPAQLLLLPDFCEPAHDLKMYEKIIIVLLLSGKWNFFLAEGCYIGYKVID